MSTRPEPHDAASEPHEAHRAPSLGAALRRQVLGQAHTTSAMPSGDDMSAQFVALAERNVWEGLWARDVLDARLRNLCTINLLIAGGHRDELELHLAGALRNRWWTRDELFEICLHSTSYCGFPVAREAFGALQKVLGDHDKAVGA